MNRISYRFYRTISGLRHTISRRLTPAGRLVALGMLLTAGMATDTEQSHGYQVFGLLLCLAFLSVVTAPFFRARFTAERRLPRFATAGRPLRYTICIRNRTKRRQAGLQVIDGLADPRPGLDEFVRSRRVARRYSLRLAPAPDFRRAFMPGPVELPSLRPGGEALVELELVPLKRGVLRFDSVIVARPDPFMLFRAFRRAPAAGSLTVLPKRYSLPQMPLPGSQHYQHGGVALAAAIGESEEFVSLRDYRPGDPLRRIHWRSWARTGRPVVKDYQDEFFVRHALILDTFVEDQNPAVFEEAVSIAASFVCTIETQESLLDLLFVGPRAFTFTIGRGVAHGDQMLEILATVQPRASEPFEALEQLVLEHAPAVSGCICIFVDWDEARRELVRTLGAMGVPALVLVIRERGGRALERRPDDPESLHVLEVGNIEAGLARL